MNFAVLDAYLERERVRAAISFALDEELGTHHGISAADFVLLQSLWGATELPDADLATQLGLRRSQLLMRLRPLEKVGLVLRTSDQRGRRLALLSAAGRRLLREARDTAAAVCQRWAGA
jgi:MarR family transcriptional regulator, organic hydroperoxide resistance regulator